MSRKTKIKLIAGFILTAVILFYSVKALKSLHPGNIFRMNLNWPLAAFSLAVFLYANYIRGLAYTRGIDRNIDRITALRIVGIGHTANMVLPLHAGEGLRYMFFPDDYSPVKRTKLLLVPAAADVVSILVLSMLAVPFAGFYNPLLLKALWILSFLCITAGALAAAALALVPRLKRYSREYMNAGTLKMLFWVLLSWVLMLLSTWAGLASFGFGLVESIRMSLAFFAATNIINFIPASPGGIGLFEYGAVLGLGGLGVGQADALSAGLLLHLIQYAALLPLGSVLYISALHGKYGEALRAYRKKKGSNMK